MLERIAGGVQPVVTAAAGDRETAQRARDRAAEPIVDADLVDVGVL